MPPIQPPAEHQARRYHYVSLGPVSGVQIWEWSTGKWWIAGQLEPVHPSARFDYLGPVPELVR